jgi:hypothetical protein
MNLNYNSDNSIDEIRNNKIRNSHILTFYCRGSCARMRGVTPQKYENMRIACKEQRSSN